MHMTSSMPVQDAHAIGDRQVVTIHICTSCRQPKTPREPVEKRAGFILYRRLYQAVATSPLQDKVTVKAADCLSLCPRPCGIALSKKDAWTYLFGDQQPDTAVADILECVAHYTTSPDGFMERKARPKSLRASILGRIPPLHDGARCI